jgi:hypothetical protein
MALKVTRKVQAEWVKERDAWLATGGTFETWYWARAAKRRAEREEADRRYSQHIAEVEARMDAGTTTMADLPFVYMVSFRREFERQIIYGNRR